MSAIDKPCPQTSPPPIPRDHQADSVASPELSPSAVVGAHQPLYQAGITSVLQQAGADVVASASTADDLARKVRAYRPELAVMDIDMEPSTSDKRVEAVRDLRAIDPGMAILILSEVPDERYVFAAVADQPQGFGFLVKARIRDIDDFAASVRSVVCGGTAIDPVVISRLAGNHTSDDAIDGLTTRERQVLGLMAQGRSNQFIADDFVVTVAAVERHITSIFAKLGLFSNGEDHRRVRAVLRYLASRNAA